jgi:hypothetical protein
LPRPLIGSLTYIFPAVKTPRVGKIEALPGLHVIDGAVVAVEKDTGSIMLFCEAERTSVIRDTCVLRRKIINGHIEGPGNRCGLTGLEPDIALDAATIATARTALESGHGHECTALSDT